VIVRSKPGQAGTITVRAASPMLDGAVTMLRSVSAAAR
jgi:hypothetical protein